MTAKRQVPLLDLQAQHQYLRDEILAELIPVIDSQRFIMGPAVAELETALAEYCGTRHAIGCASGSDALLLAWMALGIEPGDEVITSPFSFFATAGSIARLGAVPVFVDIEESTFNLDPSHLRAAVLKSERVRAIQPVHLFGGVADMAPIRAVAKEFGLPIVEDAAQAIGAEYQGIRAGAIGDIGCFSFYPGKNLGGYGDAGLLTTNDDSLAERLRLLRIHGGKDKYFHDEVGINSRIDTLQAAVLKVKLPYLDRWTQARQANAAAYRPLLQGMEDQLRVPATASYQTRHVFNQFTLLARNRDSLKRYLFEQGVGTEIYYPLPLHLQKCFRYLGYEEGSLPVAEECAKRALSIPVHPELSQEDREYVASAIRDFYR